MNIRKYYVLLTLKSSQDLESRTILGGGKTLASAFIRAGIFTHADLGGGGLTAAAAAALACMVLGISETMEHTNQSQSLLI